MTTASYIKQRELRLLIGERQMTLRITRALKKTIEPIYNLIETDLINAESRIDAILKPDYIREALHWAYVSFSYSYLKWFLQANAIQEKKEDFWLTELEALFLKKGAENVTEILGTTKTLAKKAIKEAVLLANGGASIDEINRAIRANVTDKGGVMSRGRAQTIARTEVISASNIATHESVTKMGLDLEHRWLTGGANIRDSHLEAEAQGWIPIDQPFNVGGVEMMHPCDPSGGAAEVINCKCVEIFRGI